MTIRDLNGKEIRGVLTRGQRGESYQLILRRLDADELSSIRAALDEQIAGDDIHTSSWMPGSDWTGTAYEPLYEKAARRNHTLSGLMFGLLVWEAFERHPEDWFTERFELNGREIPGRTYFRGR